MGGFVAPSVAATACSFCLYVTDKLLAHHCKLHRESLDGGCEFRNGRVVICHGRLQVLNGVHGFFMQVPVIRVFHGVVYRSVGGTCLIMN